MKTYFFDLETTGLTAKDEFRCFGGKYQGDKNHEFYSDVCHASERLEQVLNEADRVVGHNIICFDLPFILRCLPKEYRNDLFDTIITNKHKLFDTLIMGKKFSPARIKHSMESYVPVLQTFYKISEKVEIEDFSTSDMGLLRDRVAQDVEIQACLWDYFVTHKGMPESVPDYEFDQKWAVVVIEMLMTGLPYDASFACSLADKMKAQMIVPKSCLNREFPGINFNSNKQIHEALLDKYGEGLPLSEKGNPLMKKDYKEQLCQKFPILWNHYKVKEIQGCLDYIDPESALDSKKAVLNGVSKSPITGSSAVFPSLQFIGTRTGRMQYSNPPLQQMAKSVREVNRAPHGWYMLGIDVVALEMSVLGYFLKELCHDDTIWKQVQSGESVKKLTLEAFAPVMDNVVFFPGQTKEDWAKQLNFSILYGLGKKALYARLGVDSSKAKNVKKAVEKRFPSMELLNWTLQKGFKNGIVLDRFRSRIVTEKWKVLNAFVQSTAATFARRMLYVCWKELKLIDKDIHACVYNMDELQFIVPSKTKINLKKTENILNDSIRESLKSEGLPHITRIDLLKGASWKDTH